MLKMTSDRQASLSVNFPCTVLKNFVSFQIVFSQWTVGITCLNHFYEPFKVKGSLTLLFPTCFQIENSTKTESRMLNIFNSSRVKPNLEFLFQDLLLTNTPATSASDTNCTIFQFSLNKKRKLKGKKAPPPHY